MKRSFMLLAAFALTLSAMSAGAATKCKDPTTHKFIKCPVAASAPASSSPAKKGFTLPHMPMTHSSGGGSNVPAATASASHAPHCKTGKPCGNSCIAQSKVCHKS